MARKYHVHIFQGLCNPGVSCCCVRCGKPVSHCEICMWCKSCLNIQIVAVVGANDIDGDYEVS